ncbi:MAG: hypothetical protein BZY75_03750 [SAR202 cluster bacterium Io17-Chloro-G7]|nr:MAG: hypothetical protein BZY75_03750 [SAR202 cluster bacterium Io17-Chloro-G7]
MEDRFGLPMTTSSTSAAALCAEGLDLLLENNYGPAESFQKAIEADEGFSLAHALLAYTYIQAAKPKEARQSSQRALELSGGISKREQQQAQAIDWWANGKGPEAIPLIHEHLAEFPRDINMLRVAQRLYSLGCFGSGVPDFPNHLFKMTRSIESQNSGEWSYLAACAFAHHEVGLVEEALNLAERSLAARPTNAVAAHSVAHAHFEMGNNLVGSEFMADWLPTFDKRAQYYVHLSWHHALFELATGHYQKAYDLYEAEIRPSVVAKNTLALNDSASLMWRWQMYAGVTPPFSWEEVCSIASGATNSPGPAFRDAHAALALAGTEDEQGIDRFLERLTEAAKNGDPLIAEVSLPLAKGIIAFAQGDYPEAVSQLEPVFPQLARIGGSHAQREVFEDTMLEAYLKAEEFEKAEDMLRTRLNKRESIRDTYRMVQVQNGTGRLDEARSGLAAVTQGWKGADRGSAESASLTSLIEEVG